MAWIKVWPVLTEATATTSGVVSGSTEQLRENWKHLEAVLSGQHTAFSETYGVHQPGTVAAIAMHTKAAITGIPNAYGLSAGPGALAITTDTGEVLIWRDSTSSPLSSTASGSWGSLTSVPSGWSRSRATLATSASVSNSTFTQIRLWNDGASSYYWNWDDFSEFDATEGTFTAKAAGYYLVIGSVKYSSTSLDEGLQTLHAACISAYGGTYYGFAGAYGTGELVLDIMDVIYLAAAQRIILCAYHEDTSMAHQVIGGTFQVHRLL